MPASFSHAGRPGETLTGLCPDLERPAVDDDNHLWRAGAQSGADATRSRATPLCAAALDFTFTG